MPMASQPDIAVWNLAQLATALLPLIDADQDRAVAQATKAVHSFPDLFRDAWLALFRAKIGLGDAQEGDLDLIERLLDLMTAQEADFTNTFRALSDGAARDQFQDGAAFDAWAADWIARRVQDTATEAEQVALMQRTNPAVIPRNHRIEEVIQAAVSGNYAPFFKLNDVLSKPFDLAGADADYSRPPQPEEEVHATFCGT